MNQEKTFNYICYLLVAGAFLHLVYYNLYLKNLSYSGFYMLVLGACYFFIGIKKTNLAKIRSYPFLIFSLTMYVFYFFDSYFGFKTIWVVLISFLYLLVFLFAKWRADSKI